MDSINNVLLIGFDNKLEEKLQFFSDDIHLTFLNGSFESLQNIIENKRRLVEFNKILIAPAGKIYFSEVLEIHQANETEKDYVFIENDRLKINDNLIFNELGIIDLLLDTRFRKSETLTTLFLPDISKVKIDEQKLFIKIRSAYQEALDKKLAYRLHLTEDERNYLGTNALYSFLKSLINIDNNSIIIPESRHPDKYYFNYKIDLLKSENDNFTSFNRFLNKQDIESTFGNEIDSWKYENLVKGDKPNKNVISGILKSSKTSEKSYFELKEDFTAALEKNPKDTYSKFNILDINFKNFYDVPLHRKINSEQKYFSNPIIIYPEFSGIDDAVYSIMPFLYPVINESEHSYTIEGNTFKYSENDWPPKPIYF